MSAAIATLASCSALKTRHEVENEIGVGQVKTVPHGHGSQSVSADGSHAVHAGSSNSASPSSSSPNQGSLDVSQAMQPQPTPTPGSAVAPNSPSPANPAALPSGSQPRIGVILGPGGMKTYAELGVLREMERTRIPIHAIVGLEWGSVIAALYARQGQINDAEWQAFRLREDELPSKSLLSSFSASKSTADLHGFLDAVFGNSVVEKSRIDFACPAVSAKSDQALWYFKGSVREAVTRCLPYPPLYHSEHSEKNFIAAPFALDDATAWLRSRGAQVIVLVDVLGGDDTFVERPSPETEATQVVWSEIRRLYGRAKLQGVNYVIRVNTARTPLNAFDSRRDLLNAGQKASIDTLQKMVGSYHF